MTKEEIRAELERIVPLVIKDNDNMLTDRYNDETLMAWFRPLKYLEAKSGLNRTVEFAKKPNGLTDYSKVIAIGIGNIIVEVK